MAHFYAMCEHISPVLAWGFLGPHGDLKRACISFKVLGELFCFRVVFLSHRKVSTVVILRTFIVLIFCHSLHYADCTLCWSNCYLHLCIFKFVLK